MEGRYAHIPSPAALHRHHQIHRRAGAGLPHQTPLGGILDQTIALAQIVQLQDRIGRSGDGVMARQRLGAGGVVRLVAVVHQQHRAARFCDLVLEVINQSTHLGVVFAKAAGAADRAQRIEHHHRPALARQAAPQAIEIGLAGAKPPRPDQRQVAPHPHFGHGAHPITSTPRRSTNNRPAPTPRLRRADHLTIALLMGHFLLRSPLFDPGQIHPGRPGTRQGIGALASNPVTNTAAMADAAATSAMPSAVCSSAASFPPAAANGRPGCRQR